MTMSIIRKKEKRAFSKFANASKILGKFCKHKCPPNPEDLFDLYASGRAAYDLFHKFLEKVSSSVEGAYCYKTGAKEDQLPGMKGIYRVLEKGLFKYNAVGSTKLNLSKVRDVVRGGIINKTMSGLADVVKYFLECHKSGEITICRIKDRFTQPSDSGWTDMMINFYLAGDRGHHVCEAQLMHHKMKSQRKAQEGHHAYNVFRAAQEMLLTVDHDIEKLKWQIVRPGTCQPQNQNTSQVTPLNLPIQGPEL